MSSELAMPVSSPPDRRFQTISLPVLHSRASASVRDARRGERRKRRSHSQGVLGPFLTV